jgi:hypothetical protein
VPFHDGRHAAEPRLDQKSGGYRRRRTVADILATAQAQKSLPRRKHGLPTKKHGSTPDRRLPSGGRVARLVELLMTLDEIDE